MRRNGTEAISPLARENPTGPAGLSEQELSDWAESLIPLGDRSRFEKLSAVAFWAVVGAILIARFFFIDPASLRPAAAAAQYPVTQQASAK